MEAAPGRCCYARVDRVLEFPCAREEPDSTVKTARGRCRGSPCAVPCGARIAPPCCCASSVLLARGLCRSSRLARASRLRRMLPAKPQGPLEALCQRLAARLESAQLDSVCPTRPVL